MWVTYSILTALFESLKDVASKAGLLSLNEYTMAWGLRIFSLPVLIPLLLLQGLPRFSPSFLPALLVGGSLNILATVLFLKSLKHSDMSLCVPLVAFTPVFLLLTSPVMLGEWPSVQGVVGVLLIVSGSYILNAAGNTGGWTRPFVSLFREKGPRTMLVVAFIWSITSNIDKIGITGSSIVAWIVAVNLFAGLLLWPVAHRRLRGGCIDRRGVLILIAAGLLAAVRSLFQMAALTLSLVAYVISIKRTSALFTIAFAGLFFKEKGIGYRFLGGVIMITGVFLILTGPTPR